LAQVVMHELKSDAALFLARPLMTVPEYVVSFSTVKETPAMEVGDPEADVALVVLEIIVPLDEEEALLELAELVTELEELDRPEELVEAELTTVELLTELDELTIVEELEELTVDEELAGSLTFWYMFKPEGPPQIWVELPAQGILHRPSDVDTDPAWIAFPQ